MGCESDKTISLKNHNIFLMQVNTAVEQKICLTYIFVLNWINIFILFSNITNITSVSHDKVMKMYQLWEPFQISNKTRPKDLHLLPECECPRVYWPVCAHDNITYVNVCILQCLKKTLRRYGPCITYRRSSVRKMIVYIPSRWKVRNNDNIK